MEHRLARFTSAMAHEVPVECATRNIRRGNCRDRIRSVAGERAGSSGTKYAIKIWKPGMAALHSVLARTGEDLVEPVLLRRAHRPNRHPSGLHPWDYANLLALDARVSRDGPIERDTGVGAVGGAGQERHASCDGYGAGGTRRIVLCKGPGRQADSVCAARLQRYGYAQERGWFWARGGEQRVCVGCHAGPERASENRVPAVLMRTTMPVDLTGAEVADGPRGGRLI